MNEEYSVGYSEGYQAGWNAAIETTPPAAQRQWVSLTEEEDRDCYHPMRDQHIANVKAKLREKNGGQA